MLGGAVTRVEELRVGIPEAARLSSATIAVAARAIYPYDVSLDDVYARANEQLDEAAREDFAAPGTIEDAVVVIARGPRRALR